MLTVPKRLRQRGRDRPAIGNGMLLFTALNTRVAQPEMDLMSRLLANIKHSLKAMAGPILLDDLVSTSCDDPRRWCDDSGSPAPW